MSVQHAYNEYQGEAENYQLRGMMNNILGEEDEVAECQCGNDATEELFKGVFVCMDCFTECLEGDDD